MLACIKSQPLNPPVRPVCPEAPVWPVEPLAPESRHNSLVLCHVPSHPLWKALTPCHACIHLDGKPELDSTCETRLPRGPGLACGAAGPCKQAQFARNVSYSFSSSVKSTDELPRLHSSVCKVTASRTHL